MAPAPRRVAHLLGRSAGGIRRHVRYLAAHPPAGYETLGVWGPSELEDYFDDVPFYRTTPLDRVRGPKRAQVIHAHGLNAGGVALQPMHEPVVLTVHTDITTQGRTAGSRALRFAARRIAARADAVIAVSDLVAKDFPGAHVIAPATEPLPPPSRTRAEVRNALGAPDDRTVVVAVARLHADKGLDLFVDALRDLDADGWIAGDGPLRPELEAKTRGTSVRLLGPRDDVADLLAAADVFALPSVGEAYGIAVQEALSAGLPVVTSDAGAMPQLVGDAGIVVSAGDRAAFVDAVHRVVSDEALRAGLASRARARRFPDPLELVAAIGRVYDEVDR
jgi:glycosyltransferase involved in cell wall biosynthesis